MKKTFIFLLTLSLCLAKSTTTISNTIIKHITPVLEELNETNSINFPSPINSTLCTQNLTCNNGSQFFEELIEVLDKIKVDELSENATRTLKILKENVKEVINYFQNGHTMKGRKHSCPWCCQGHPSWNSYYKSLQYLNRKCHVV